MGYGFRTKHWFRPLKSEITQTVLSFLGMMKVGAAHSDDAIGRSNPKSCNHCISFFVTCS